MSERATYSIHSVTIFFVFWYLAMLVWWLIINQRNLIDTNENYAFGLVFSLIPFVGGLVGFTRARHWGGVKSLIGKSVLFLSLGLMSWGTGGLVWAYYNFFDNINVPWPSLVDIAYLLAWPLWSLGIIFLASAVGARLSMRTSVGKIQMLVVPALAAALSYYLLVTVGRGGMLIQSSDFVDIFFTVAYPMGDLVLLTLVGLLFSLSYQYLGGKFRAPVRTLIIGFFINYVADVAFSWMTTRGTFFVASWVDLLYMTAMTVLTLGVVAMDPRTILGKND